MKTSNQKKNVVLALFSGFLLCLPVTGFVHGFFACKNCDRGFLGFLERIFIGLVQSFNTILTCGKPWKTEAGIAFDDLRLWVIAAFLLLSLATYFFLIFIQKVRTKRK